MKNLITPILSILFVINFMSTGLVVAQSDQSFHSYSELTEFLNAHVSKNGNVDYAGIKKDQKRLNNLIKDFKENYPAKTWSKHQRLAYWINAYNLFTLKLVSDKYPISSIKKVSEKPWDKKFIELGDKVYSLSNIENDIIRKWYKDPRIHFALNCASASCPLLLNQAYTGKNLSSQMTRQTKLFLADKSKNNFSNPDKIQLSKIFEWYKSDFDVDGGVISFINKYRKEQLQSPAINYLPYSWELNK